MKQAPNPTSDDIKFSSMAWRTGVDMVSNIIVGTGFGWLIDFYFALRPWGIIIGFMLGAISGFVTIYRKLCKLGYGFKRLNK